MKSSLRQFWELSRSLHDSLETGVHDRCGSYRGITFEALYTSMEDLIAIFESELVQGDFLDLGCGTGFTSLLYGSLYPDRKSCGIEFEKARLLKGEEYLRKVSLPNVTLIEANLLEASIPDADTYFLYFPTGHVLDRILHELYRKERKFRLIAVESHGDLMPRLGLENWLKVIGEIPLSSARHYPRARVYERTFEERKPELLPFDLSFRKEFLLIGDSGERWIGSTYKMEWTAGDRFELKYPPRTINWKNVTQVLTREGTGELFQKALELSSLGELKISTNEKTYQGFIRKIIVSPSFKLEISTGEKVEWSHIIKISQGTQICYESPSFS